MVDSSFRDYLLMVMCLGATSIGGLIVLTFNTYAPKVMEELGISPTLMGFAMGASMLFLQYLLF